MDPVSFQRHLDISNKSNKETVKELIRLIARLLFAIMRMKSAVLLVNKLSKSKRQE